MSEAERISELEMELSAVDDALNRVNAAQHPDRSRRILDTIEHLNLVSDAAIRDAWKRVDCLLRQRDYYATICMPATDHTQEENP